MAFKPLTGADGKTISLGAENAAVFTKHCGVKINTTGYAILAADGDPELEFVSLEAKTIGASDGEALLCLHVDPSIYFECDLDAAIDATEVGDTIDIHNSTTLAPANSTDDVFKITHIVPSCNTKARGYFMPSIAARLQTPS
jgi:hypothetical protein